MSSLKYRPRSGQLRKWHLSVPKASHWNKGMGAQSVRANVSISSAPQLNHKPSLSRTPKTLCTTDTAPAEAFRFMLTDRCNSPNSSMLSPLWKKLLAVFLLHFLSAGRKLSVILKQQHNSPGPAPALVQTAGQSDFLWDEGLPEEMATERLRSFTQKREMPSTALTSFHK